MSSLVRSLPRPRVPSLPSWRVMRRRIAALAIALLALAAAYMLWLRNSSLVAVEEVTVKGAEHDPAAESALRAAGLEQSTLNVDLGALEAAVADDPAVRSLSATTDFPHGLTIAVELRSPVGYLKSAGALVAGDGVILDRTGHPPDGIPTIAVKGAAGGGEVGGDALRVARVLGAAPQQLLALVQEASIDPDSGVVVEVDPGLQLRFGSPGRADLKWRAAAAVLADPGFDGAAYLDLSVPDRPVAGGVAEGSTSSADQSAVSPPDPTVPAPPDPAAASAPAPAPDAATTDPATADPAADPAPAAPATPAAAAGGTTVE